MSKKCSKCGKKTIDPQDITGYCYFCGTTSYKRSRESFFKSDLWKEIRNGN